MAQALQLLKKKTKTYNTCRKSSFLRESKDLVCGWCPGAAEVLNSCSRALNSSSQLQKIHSKDFLVEMMEQSFLRFLGG